MTGTARLGMRRVIRTESLGLPYLIAVTVFLLVPVAVLAIYSFWEAGFLTVEQTFTLDTYLSLLESSSFWGLLFRSLAVGLVCATLITVIAFTLCHGIVFRFPKWKYILFGLVIGASLASFMGRLLAARTLLGEGGVLNQFLMSIGVPSAALGFLSFGYPTIVLTLTYMWLPTAALILFGSLQDVSQTTLEASRDLGASRWATLWQVTIPQASSGIKATFALMFIGTTADYITPSLVGGTKGALLASGLQSTFLGEGNLPRGAAMAFITIAVILAVIGVVLILGKVVGPLVKLAVTATAFMPGRSRIAGVSLSKLATFPILVLELLPIVVITIFSFNSAPVIGLPFTGITTGWYTDIVSAPGFRDALEGSVLIMVFSVLGSLALGTPLAFALARRGVRRGVLMTLLPIAAAAPIVIPQTVIGVSYYSSTLLFQIPLGYLPTIVAHIMLSSPFVGIILSLRLSTADPYIGEAARDLGANNVYRARTVTLPMLLPSIIGVGFLVAAFSMDEVLVTTFTIGANSTLPVWMLSQARQGLNPGINALAVILLLGTLTLFVAAALSMLALRLRGRRPSAAPATEDTKDEARELIPA